MAVNRFRGDAQAIAQITTLTVTGTFAVGQTYSVTCNRKIVSYTTVVTDASNTDAATGLLNALRATAVIEFKEIVYTSLAAVVTCTAAIPGKLFTFSAVSGSGTGGLSQSTTQASKGPNHWDDANNWSLAAIPVNTNDVVIEGCAVDILYGLDQNAVSLASLTINSTYTGAIGLPEFNGQYFEYREPYLKISATTVRLGDGDGNCSQRLQLNLGTVQTAVTILKTGSIPGAGQPSVYLRGTHASNTLDISRGIVGVAFEEGALSTFLTMRIGYVNSPDNDVTLYIGSGVTMTTVNMSGGQVLCRSAVPTLNMDNGTWTQVGNVAITTVNGQRGRLYYQSNGTITTLTCGTDFEADFTRDIRARTITNSSMQKSSKFRDSFKTVTFTNPLLLDNCSLSEVELDLGSNISLQRT